MLNEIGAVRPQPEADQEGSVSRLKDMCAEFESIFMTYMLKSMRSAFVEEGIMGKSQETKIMNAMFDENLALETAKGGGIGLGDILFDRLFDRLGETSTPSTQKETLFQGQNTGIKDII